MWVKVHCTVQATASLANSRIIPVLITKGFEWQPQVELTAQGELF